MENLHRCFLVTEGPNNSSSNYCNNKIHIIQEDPATAGIPSTFLSSPLFCLDPKGAASLPILQSGSCITLFMIPTIFPTFGEISNKFAIGNKVWFSLGLANLVIIEDRSDELIADKIIAQFKGKSNITAAERWDINDGKIETKKILFQQHEDHVEKCGTRISDKLPLHLKFAVSEFIISVEIFLTASKRFTPHYYEGHKKTIQVSTKRLVDDLSFVCGDETFTPSSSVIKSFGQTTAEKTFETLTHDANKEKREEIINDRHGRIIQFNSSLSYLYSQAYAGSFPIFEHNGLIRRHSLLGIGSAISALFELVSQTEQAFITLPFDDFSKTGYQDTNIPEGYFAVLSEPSNYHSKTFQDDNLKLKVKRDTAQVSKQLSEAPALPRGYYNRLAFFSGRLEFREYDFSATAAIQVLVESHSLEWHIINYTHEIIHHHVRGILNQNLVNVPLSIRKTDYIDWLQKILDALRDIHENTARDTLTYKDFFVYSIINFCINSRYFGSLSRESDHDMVVSQRIEYRFPDVYQLKGLIQYIYKDVNEIFVHVIDFSYIYKRDVNAYLLSIWSSWSTVASVTTDLRQYIIRTLIIIGITKTGTTSERFQQSKSTFLELIEKLKNRNKTFVFDNLQQVLEDKLHDDLLYRFTNCIILADIVYNFFVGDIELLLENNDQQVLEKMVAGSGKELEDETHMYDLGRNEFSQVSIKSKTVFILDQLIREVRVEKESLTMNDPEKERISSWLLLSLSTYNPS